LALRLLSWDGTRPIESRVFCVAAGVTLLAVAILSIGLAGALRLPVLASLLLLAAGLSWRELREVPALVSAALATPWREREDPTLLVFGLSAAALAVLAMVVFGLMPPVDWDSLMYHLKIPAQYLEAGRIYLPADNLHAAHIGVIHMLYVPLLAVSSEAGPAMLNVALAVLLALAAYSFCARFLAVRVGELTLGLIWGTTTVLLVAISPRVDVALTFFLFLALYALIAFLEDADETETTFQLGAVLLGTAAGIKLSGIPYAAALAPLVVWAATRRGVKASGVGRLLLWFGVCFAAASLPWLAKNWLLLRSPIYPYLAEPRLAAWLAPLFGGTAWPAGIDSGISDIVWEFRARFNLWDAFFFPGRLTIEGEGAHYYLNPAFLALPLCLLFIRDRVLNWLVLPALGYLCLVLLVMPSPNLRYLLPAVPPLTIAVSYAMVKLGERYLSRVAQRTLLILLAVIALAPSSIAAYSLVTRSLTVPHLLGARSANEYLATSIGPDYLGVVDLVNSEPDDESLTLMLFEARGYYFHAPIIQDNLSSNWPLLASALAPSVCLNSIGVTHVLLGIGTLNYFAATGGLDPQRVRWSDFTEFADRCLDETYRNRLYILFRTKPDVE
ncbi:MAG TPA: hypothetical protein VLC48_03555, partial [Gemmatimonadota bacterium]|nr:hypothetical protein [Gemmatimonadota bacterium]